MEYKLILKMVTFDGREITKSYDVSSDPAAVQAAINRLVSTFMQAGFIEPTEFGMRVTRLNTIEVEVPSILVAQPGEIPSTLPNNGRIKLG
jgi:hypothetical protein